ARTSTTPATRASRGTARCSSRQLRLVRTRPHEEEPHFGKLAVFVRAIGIAAPPVVVAGVQAGADGFYDGDCELERAEVHDMIRARAAHRMHELRPAKEREVGDTAPLVVDLGSKAGARTKVIRPLAESRVWCIERAHHDDIRKRLRA